MTCIDQVVHKYRALRCNHIGANLPALLAQAEANELSYLQLAEQLVELELKGREKNRLAMNLRKAGFPVAKRLEEFDYRHQTTITKRQVNQLLDFRFVEERANLVFIGPPGVGKTHLAIGIGLKGIEAGYKVEGDLRTEVSMNIKRLMDLGCYRGLRHRRGLPVPFRERAGDR